VADVREAVYSWLTAGAAVAATLGDRIYPRKADQDAAHPYAVYEQTAHERVRTMKGWLNLYGWSADWHVRGSSEAQVRAAADALRDRLLELRPGASLAGGGVLVRSVGFGGDESDGFEPPDNADEKGVCSADLTVTIWYERGV
jgi:hypothetical protein